MINELNHKAELFQIQETSVSSIGDQVFSETSLGGIYCRIEPKGSRESMYGEQLRADTTHLITLRWRSNFNHMQYIIWNGRKFNLNSPINPEEGKLLVTIQAIEIR